MVNLDQFRITTLDHTFEESLWIELVRPVLERRKDMKLPSSALLE